MMKKTILIALIVITNIALANAQGRPKKVRLYPAEAEKLFEQFEKTVRLTLRGFEAKRANGRQLTVKKEGEKLTKSYTVPRLHGKVLVKETFAQTSYQNIKNRVDIEVTFEIVNLTQQNIQTVESNFQRALYYAGYKKTAGNGSYSGWENYTYKVGMNRSKSSVIIWIEKLDHNN